MRVFAIATLAVLSSGYGLSTLLANDNSIVDQRIAAADEGIVVIRVPDGAIAIEGWRTSEVEVTGSLVGGASRLGLTSSHGHVEVVVATAEQDEHDGTKLRVRVPRGSSLDVETNGATVRVDGVAGIVRIQSQSGDLTINGRPMGIVARSELGDIDISAERVPGIAHSEEGSVKLRGRSAETIVQRDPALCDGGQRWRSGCRLARADMHGYGAMGRHISSIVQRVLDGIDVNGRVDYDQTSGQLDFDIAGSMTMDPADLEELFVDLELMLADIQHEVGQSMMMLGEELQNLGVDLQRR